MKRLTFPIALIVSALVLFPRATFGQDHYEGCPFSLNGTWRSSTDGQMNPTLARFSDGVMTELARNTSGKGPEWTASGKSRYRLDNPKKPKAMILTKVEKGNPLSAGTTLEIKAFDDGMFVTGLVGGPMTRWTRIDPYRYFVVLAAGRGEPDTGGPGFAELIKTDGVHTEIDTFGAWPVRRQFDSISQLGVVPEDLRKQFDHEPGKDAGSMLRVEVTAGPYNRALKVMKTWQRRSEENTLLYPYPYLNNQVYLNQLVSSLNKADVLAWGQGTPCGKTINLYVMTEILGQDEVMRTNNFNQAPYYFFKKLREMNNTLHLSDSQFQAAMAGGQSNAVAMK